MAFRVLAGEKEDLNEFPLAAEDHARKALIPLTFGYFRFSVEPLGEQPELIGTNLARLDPVKQMLEKRGREITAADSGHHESPNHPEQVAYRQRGGS